MSPFSAWPVGVRTSRAPEPFSAASPGKAYEPLLEIGRGGMGIVTLALARGPEGFAKLVVLKRLHEHLAADPESVQMLLEEARISARLSHPNIVQVYEATVQGGVPTIVMEYLEGQPLPALIDGASRLPLELHLNVLSQVLRGLDAAHELLDYDGRALNLVHRDMSPHNVFVGYDGVVKVLDFGIAKMVGGDHATRTGVLKGKLRYMAPEQVAGEELDRRTDIFSVGIMLWEALSGRRLWDGANDGQVLRALLEGSVPSLPCEGLDARLAAVCSRALAPEPARRYATAAEFRRELTACLEGATGNLDEALVAHLARHFGERRDAMRRRVAERIGRGTSVQPPRAVGAIAEASERVGAPVARRRPSVLLAAVVLAALLGVVFLAARPTATSAPAPAPRDGRTALECGPGTKSCDGRCVSVESPIYGCAASSCAPCAIANATPRCGRDGACAVAACYRGYDDCDGLAENGCETSSRTDPQHCGGCSRACSALPNAQVGCGDSCQIWRCAVGYEDCNGVTADGCEVNTGSDGEHCGACGRRCPGQQRCRAGRCGP